MGNLSIIPYHCGGKFTQQRHAKLEIDMIFLAKIVDCNG